MQTALLDAESDSPDGKRAYWAKLKDIQDHNDFGEDVFCRSRVAAPIYTASDDAYSVDLSSSMTVDCSAATPAEATREKMFTRSSDTRKAGDWDSELRYKKNQVCYYDCRKLSDWCVDRATTCYFGCSVCPDVPFANKCGPMHGHQRCTGGATSASEMVFHSNMRKSFCDRAGDCGNSPRYFEAEDGLRVNARYDFLA